MANVSLPDLNPAVSVNDSDLILVRQGTEDLNSTVSTLKQNLSDTYLEEANNLSDLTDTAIARTNLGVSSTTESDGKYLEEANNLSDLDNAATSRTNLGLGTAAVVNTGTGTGDVPTTSQADTRYLNASDNLADIPSPATAKSNLELGSASEYDAGTGSNQIPTVGMGSGIYLEEANNLSDLDDIATARYNLGLGDSAQFDTGTNLINVPLVVDANSLYLNEDNNLSDIPNVTTARTNLGVYGKSESDGRYLNESSNLSDLDNKETSRTNLGMDLWQTIWAGSDYTITQAMITAYSGFVLAKGTYVVKINSTGVNAEKNLEVRVHSQRDFVDLPQGTLYAKSVSEFSSCFFSSSDAIKAWLRDLDIPNGTANVVALEITSIEYSPWL